MLKLFTGKTDWPGETRLFGAIVYIGIKSILLDVSIVLNFF
jgi:hypothetical protein